MLTIKDISQLIRDIKPDIQDDYTDYLLNEWNDNPLPYIQITIAANRDDLKTGKKAIEWTHQTGDNSYAGDCYFYDTWATGYIFRRTNSRKLARELITELYDQCHW